MERRFSDGVRSPLGRRFSGGGGGASAAGGYREVYPRGLDDPRQDLHDLAHPGAGLGLSLQASVGQRRQRPRRFRAVLSAEPGIDDEVELLGVGGVGFDPTQELLLASGEISVQRSSSGYELVEHDAEAPDVALGREPAALEVFWGSIADGADDLDKRGMQKVNDRPSIQRKNRDY